MPAIWQPKSFLSPTLVMGKSQCSLPSPQNGTPISSLARGLHYRPPAPSRAIWFAVGKFHPMHHQRNRATAGRNLFAVQLHVHGQSVFQGCAADNRPPRVGLVPAHANQPNAKIPHGALKKFLKIVADVAGSHIAKKNGVRNFAFPRASPGNPWTPTALSFQTERIAGRQPTVCRRPDRKKPPGSAARL